ncbi:MAG TPA: hypothetical protein VNK81_08330, partial [Thermodesulfobacteriota bacterium]|nr:hypothetical protein [Thermodesulfobacteriota bacterium]
ACSKSASLLLRVALRVKVVVFFSVKRREPDGSTVPVPGSWGSDRSMVLPLVFHETLVLCPSHTSLGFASKDTILGAHPTIVIAVTRSRNAGIL